MLCERSLFEQISLKRSKKLMIFSFMTSSTLDCWWTRGRETELPDCTCHFCIIRYVKCRAKTHHTMWYTIWYLFIKFLQDDNDWFVATSFEKITHFRKNIKVRQIWNQLNALWTKNQTAFNLGPNQRTFKQEAHGSHRSPEEDLKFVNVFSLFRNYLSLEKGVALHLNKLDIWSPKRCFVPSLVEIDPAVLEKKIFEFRQCIFAIS